MRDSCFPISELLEKYFDQEITDQERSLVESHLLGCRTCQDALRKMKGVRDLIKTPIEEAVQREDFRWLWQKIEREIRRGRPTWWQSLRSRVDITLLLRRKVWIPAVAAAVIIILFIAPLLFKKTPSHSGTSAVEYIESDSYNVMVYETEKGKMTVIWLLEGPEEGLPTS